MATVAVQAEHRGGGLKTSVASGVRNSSQRLRAEVSRLTLDATVRVGKPCALNMFLRRKAPHCNRNCGPRRGPSTTNSETHTLYPRYSAYIASPVDSYAILLPLCDWFHYDITNHRMCSSRARVPWTRPMKERQDEEHARQPRPSIDHTSSSRSAHEVLAHCVVPVGADLVPEVRNHVSAGSRGIFRDTE